MASGKNNGQTDELLLFLALGLFVIFAIFVLPKYQWVFFEYWRWSKIVQFTIFSWVDMDFFSSMEAVRQQLLTADDFINIKENLTSSDLSYEEIQAKHDAYWQYIETVDGKYGQYLAWFAASTLAIIGFRLLTGNKSITFQYNFETFLQKFSTVHEHYKDLTFLKGKERLDLIGPEEAERRGILPITPYDFAVNGNYFGKPSRPIYDPEAMVFDEELAKEVFSKQLGPKWTGEENLNKVHGYIYSKLKKIVESKKQFKAEDIMNKHAFVLTGLRSLYIQAKKTGIYAPSWFRAHIKQKDINAWRMISDTGRLPLVLGGGMHVHHEQEVSLGMPIHKPAVEAAVFALAETIGYDVEKLSNAGYYSKSEVNNEGQ